MYLDLSWEPCAQVPLLERGAVHVIQFSLEATDAERATLAACLNEEERARAARFKRVLHQQRFTVGRGQLRRLLGQYTSQNPASLRFSYGKQGKPSLADGDGVTFNLSHSEDQALLAVARGNALGVDLEWRRPRVRMASIAARFFHPEEADLLARYDEGAKTQAFYQLWTAKEALLKGVGGGLTLPLNQCAFSLDRVPLGLRCYALPALVASDWQVYPLAVAGDYAAALAVAGKSDAILGFRWRGEEGAPVAAS